MSNFKTVFVLTATALLTTACSSGEDTSETNPIEVQTDHINLQVEDWTGRSSSATLNWLPIQLDSDNGQAAKLVAQDSAELSDNGLPSLTYDIKFLETGTYTLNVHGRHDSNYPQQPEQQTTLTFGSDDGNIELAVNGFDDQWQWINTDVFGQSLTIEVKTPGEHLFKITAATAGLMLDQIMIDRLADTTVSTNNDDAEPQPAAEQTPTAQTNPNSNPVETTTDPVQPSTPIEDTTAVTTTPLPPTNTAPTIAAIEPLSTQVGKAVTITATATDDGLPQGNIYYYWSKTSGPGTVVFSVLNTATIQATFSAQGTYKLQLNTSDGELYNNREITVNVAPADPIIEPTAPAETTESHHLGDKWTTLKTNGKVTARHEAGGVMVNGKLYVIGGRKTRPVDMYDPQTNQWKTVANAPMELHHFQPVAIGTKIYVVGAFTCCYPVEKIVSNIYIFDTKNNNWTKGSEIPANRQRGGAGAAVHNGKIYLLGGNTNGHSGGAVGWFDEYNPATGKWKTLANAPDARDHATVAIADGKLVAAAGRESDFPNTFQKTVSRTNVYDFNTGKWSREANIPTVRAGTMTVTHGSDVLVIGGESAASEQAHDDVEAYNVNTREWRKLTPLNTGRHGGAAAFIDGVLHAVTGSERRAAGKESTSHEVLK